MRSVNSYIKGSTLVEMMVASVIGIIAIGTIGSIFITNQRISSENSLELLLSQNLFSAAQMMKEEIWRAGYDSDSGKSIKLSGATNTIYVNQVSVDEAYIGFAYLQDGASSVYRNIVYQFKENKLNYCLGESGGLLAINEKPLGTASGAVSMKCESVFFNRQIQVDALFVEAEELSTGASVSQKVDLELKASLVNADVSHKVRTSVVQRNWQ
ncbi:Pilus assembly protein PilW [Vibrio crassostreae]|uniref:PilW family protein n=1 Tax=Vibrio crassostreae TaxID=246167 RepID=UPI001B30E7D3|nr:pilus assembly protein PilW [Vibrio crassostreae]CAK2720811.1 Pilus assembly protein PilW [Vibrio crassostreae]CAK3219914.1 Pilus assembly protein PilW [Vibrio crassostreae]CAK3241000.1 Pilus assembly protein PilW [Vibrio crassostreae]CAK3243986.1 Pilus assembly protein PilW [Vibrio crassostreae]CAK3259300.1 Pilus assembly protein PilW [Vibrio crassostreae]